MRGETVLVDGTVEVPNVLVHVGEFERGNYHDTDINKPVGTNADYTLYFPMDYEGDLTGHRITVRGIDCAVLGHPDHERPAAVFGSWLGQWDMTVKVKRTLAAYAETIRVLRTTVSRDTLGNRSKSDAVLYAGAAQARKAEGDEKADAAGARDTETWIFVLPFQQSLDGIPSQQLSVEYGGASWRVLDVTDVDNAGETHRIKAVRLT